jgi:ribose 5-phosphate isomerase A
MIKGAGGAFFKEKVLAYMAYHFLVIVDETKLVSHLGTKPLPVEVAMFGAQSTQKHLEKSGFEGHFRQKPDGSFYITEHHNYIFDIDLKNRHLNLEQEHLRIKHIPGVIETGFFPCLPGQIIIGCKDGSTVIQ